MSVRRRSTVHDFASLRLHPDGSRVQAQSDTSGDAKISTNKKARAGRLAHYAAFDTQRNRIALDAGGTASVKRRRRHEIDGGGDSGGKKEPEQVEDSENLMTSGESSQRRKPSRHPSVPVDDTEDEELDNLKDNRAKKRRKFYRNFSFLDDVNEDESSHLQMVVPVPSSDLLKCIHHFSSGYYAACGCLINAPKEARKERKARRSANLARHVAEDGRRHDSRSMDEVAGSDSDHNTHQKDGSDSESEDEQERIGGDLEIRGARSRKRRRNRPEEKPPRDMYKAFDGSALMAIGMLLQEHVKELVSAEPPEDWLRHMGARGGTRIGKKLKFEDDQVNGCREGGAPRLAGD